MSCFVRKIGTSFRKREQRKIRCPHTNQARDANQRELSKSHPQSCPSRRAQLLRAKPTPASRKNNILSAALALPKHRKHRAFDPDGQKPRARDRSLPADRLNDQIGKARSRPLLKSVQSKAQLHVANNHKARSRNEQGGQRYLFSSHRVPTSQSRRQETNAPTRINKSESAADAAVAAGTAAPPCQIHGLLSSIIQDGGSAAQGPMNARAE